MHVVLIQNYLIGLVGLVLGAAGSVVITGFANRGRLSTRDARLTAPLLLAAGFAHLVLIPAVELERQVLFGLYGLGIIATVALGLAGFRIWRVGAVLLPAGSIAAYFYFGVLVHQVDYAGLTIKLVEIAAVASALLPAASRSATRRSLNVASG